MMALGRDVSSFFPDVVKNVIVESQGALCRSPLGRTALVDRAIRLLQRSRSWSTCI
jgi:hypothetical protein